MNKLEQRYSYMYLYQRNSFIKIYENFSCTQNNSEAKKHLEATYGKKGFMEQA